MLPAKKGGFFIFHVDFFISYEDFCARRMCRNKGTASEIHISLAVCNRECMLFNESLCQLYVGKIDTISTIRLAVW